MNAERTATTCNGVFVRCVEGMTVIYRQGAYLQAGDPGSTTKDKRTNHRPMRTTTRTILLLTLVLSITSTEAQQLIPTRGKEFYLGYMQNYDGGANPHLYLYVSSDVNTTGTATSPTGWNQPFTVTANTVTTVEVPIANMHQGSELIDNKSVLVQTADTVAVYALNFQTATADAAVIYPTKSLGTEYRVQAFYGLDGFGTLNSELLIVATADGTTIEITPACTTFAGQPPGVPFTIQLNAGQSYQVQALNGVDDLTGSVVRGTPESGGCRPFAVFSGSVCPDVPTGCFACDHVFEENLPTSFWGTKYFTVPWANTTAYLYRILADQDNTNVSIDGGASITLNAGQFNETIGASGTHCITSDRPVSVAQFMQGSDCSGGQSDPALLILNGEEQKINDITFATVISPNITSQFINVIVDANDINNVTLDGNTVPSIQFTSFPSCSDHAYAQLALDQASHRISCPNGLTGYVYGTGPNYETYAYSVGAFSSLPTLNYDTVFCGLDTTDFVTLSPPQPVFNPYWTVASNPNDTLFEGLVYTFQPNASDVYVLTGTENVSGCTQQYFFSIELADPPATSIMAPSSVCAYTPVPIDLQLVPNGTYLYQWTPEAGLNNPNAQDPIATAAHNTWYHVTVSTLTGCAATEDSVLVTVTPGDVLNVDAVSDPELICAGDNAQLNVHVRQIIGQDDFDNGTGPLWQQVQNGTPNTLCGSVFGDALWFDGSGNRFARTVPLNVSTGGAVRFALKICTGTAPCEDVDPGENILVEYSINGGTSWTIMANYGDNAFPEFGSVVLPIPPPAQTIATLFRWRQLLNGGAGQDNWVLDDVAIATDDNTGITFNWSSPFTLNDATISDPVATPPATLEYIVQMTDQTTGCTYSDSVQVSVGPLFDLQLTNDTAICGAGLSVQLSAVPVQAGNYSWTWTPDNGSLTALNIQDPVAFPFTSTDYIVHVTSQFGCVVTDTVNVAVVQALSTTVFVAPNPICAGEEAQLQAQAFEGSGNYSFSWTPPGSLDDALIATPIATPGNSTNYIVTVSDLLCGAVQQNSIFLTVLPAPQLDLGPDQYLCPDEVITLNAGPATVYLWSTQATSSSINVDTPGEYWVHAGNGNCNAADTVTITATPDPGELGTTVFSCAGSDATLTIPYANGGYSWAGGETTQSILANVFGDYAFTLTDVYGCTYNDIAHLMIDPLELGVIVPNVISPNGDGKNDVFEPQAGGNKQVAVTIFNRFGQEIFAAGNLNQLWGGSKSGSPVPDGTYFYVVRYKPACENVYQELKGTVTVVR